MADEARAMLDALMGADRNASLASKGISASKKRSTSSRDSGGSSSNDGVITKRQKRSCYSANICPYYTAWGIDMYELFTNTKSDLGGSNEFIVDEDAHEEFKALPEVEKERLGYERMLYRKLGDLVRQVDRVCARNKEKLRQELAQKRRENRNVDPVCLAKPEEEKLDRAASMAATLEQIEIEISKMVQQLQELVEEDEEILKNKQQEEETAVQLKKQQQQEEETTEKAEAAAEQDDAPSTTEDAPSTDAKAEEDTPNETTTAHMEEIQKREQREHQKIALVDAILLRLQQVQPLRDNIAQLTKSLYIFRADTSADKIVCEVSGNFMSSRDAEERIAAHFAGKQYIGWKAVRDKFAELDKKFRGRPPPRQPPLLPHEREFYKHETNSGGPRVREGYAPPPPPDAGRGGWDHRGGAGYYADSHRGGGRHSYSRRYDDRSSRGGYGSRCPW